LTPGQQFSNQLFKLIPVFLAQALPFPYFEVTPAIDKFTEKNLRIAVRQGRELVTLKMSLEYLALVQ
jgi:hypothetical protein